MRLMPLPWLVACAAACALGCEETPLDPSSDGGPPADARPGATPPTALVDDPSLMLRRLTRGELERSLTHVLGPIRLVDAEPDRHHAGFARVGARLSTLSGSGVERIAFALEDAMDQAFADPAALAGRIGCDPAQAGCVDDALAALARRAWRRPPTADERAARRALAARCGGGLAGLRCGVSSLLYSPHFLYRVELPTDGVFVGFDMASRLSYFLWGGPPDDALLDAAAAGELDTAEGVRRHAARMVDDPRARVGLRAFVDEWFRTDRLDRLGRDILAVTFEDVQFELGRSGQLQPWLDRFVYAAGEELRRLVEHHVFDRDADYLDLLTTDRTVVDENLLGLYRLTDNAEGEGFPGQVRGEADGEGEGDEGEDDEGEDDEGEDDEGEDEPFDFEWCVEDCLEWCLDEEPDAPCHDLCPEECEYERQYYEGEGGEDEAPAFEGGDGAGRITLDEAYDADGFARATHAADSPRRGLLGTLAVLGQLGKQNETSPTRRGLYVMRRILCLEVGEPPDDIDVCHRPDGVSRRASMEDHHMCAASCAGCHSQMDPIGFALDRFDTVGRLRRVDDWGFPLDTDVSWRLLRPAGSADLRFDSLRTMATTFRELPEATTCVTRQIYRFATGREEHPADAGTIAALDAMFRGGGRRLRSFLVDFTATDAFRRAAVAEAAPSAPTLAELNATLFGPHCGACHVGPALGGLDLGADDGQLDRLRAPSSAGMPQITPGDVERSYLWHKVAGTHLDVGGAGARMPPNQPISDDDMQRLRAWIEGL